MNIKEIEYCITDGEYRDLLDELYGDVEICGMTFSSGYALKELDPIAFDCGKNDYETGTPSKWECGACNEEYEEEEDAEACCKVEETI
jgi:hypothetical protein